MHQEIATYWEHIVDTYSSYQIHVLWSHWSSLFLYWSLGLFYLFIDIFQPHFLYKYKIQPVRPLDYKLLAKTLVVVLFNNVVSFTAAHLNYPLTAASIRIDKELPGIGEVIIHFIIFLLAKEVTFYYLHRALHYPAIYPYIHKLHHEYKAPIGLSAQYAHPIEHVFVNLVPLAVGPAICKTHVITNWIWLMFYVWETVTVHSGYDFPFLHRGLSRFHDMHHEKTITCFGFLHLCDWIHGTDKIYKDKYAKRDTNIKSS